MPRNLIGNYKSFDVKYVSIYQTERPNILEDI
jgi:hypothetical protein